MAGHSEQRFEVDGVVYTSLDDVPQPHRDTIAAMLADRDGNGVPDVFDGEPGVQRVVHDTSVIEVDGVRYASIDDVPEPQRSLVREALAAPSPHEPGPSTTSMVPPPTASLGAPTPSPIVRSAGWSNRTKLIAAFVAIDVIAIAAVVWFVAR